jgi:hypothetical protein
MLGGKLPHALIEPRFRYSADLVDDRYHIAVAA